MDKQKLTLLYTKYFGEVTLPEHEMDDLVYVWEHGRKCNCILYGDKALWYSETGIIGVGADDNLNLNIARTGYSLGKVILIPEQRAERILYFLSENFNHFKSGGIVNLYRAGIRSDFKFTEPLDLACRIGRFERDTLFLVIDCEGYPQEQSSGARQVGGLICSLSNSGRYISVIEDFMLDGALVNEGLSRVYAMMKSYSGHRYFKAYTFGSQDAIMLRNTFKSKVLLNRLEFVDIRALGGSLSVGKQNEVAERYNVKVHTPKHNALNDARTLFNILAVYLYNGGTI